MRIVGALLFLAGAAATGYTIRAAFERDGAVGVAFGLVAPLAVLLAVTGLVLVFVPGFL